jgi:hypothetical protein
VKKKKTQKTLWEQDRIQFPRLLAELRTIGLQGRQYFKLKETMDLEIAEIDELLERAERAWRRHLSRFYSRQVAPKTSLR